MNRVTTDEPDEPNEPLETLRAMVQRLAYETSLRNVGRLAGMSPEVVRKFLDGSTPSPRTRSKLLTVCGMGAVGEVGMEAMPAASVLSTAVAHLPAVARQAAVEELRGVVARRSRAAGVPVPTWADDGLGN
jgi:hypothetical protein